MLDLQKLDNLLSAGSKYVLEIAINNNEKIGVIETGDLLLSIIQGKGIGREVLFKLGVTEEKLLAELKKYA